MLMKNKNKLIRVTTVPGSLHKLLENQLSFMKPFYEVIAISSPSMLLEEISKKEGVRVFGVEMTRKITPFKDILAVWNLYNYLKKEKPLIVHTHTPKAGTVGMLSAKLAGVPIRLHTVAGLPLLETSGMKRLLLNLVEKITYACATKVYPNSSGLKEIIVENSFCSVAKLKVIAEGSSNGINTGYFNPDLILDNVKLKLKSELNIESSDFVFIFVGRLVGDKGINELVKAFDLFQFNHPNSKLLLVGDYEEQLDPIEQETVKIIQTNPNIITVGLQSDVRPYFAIANCLVFPSYREGFPNVVMQAGAMCLPCIVTNINGCNEIINEGINGTIIPVKNVESIIDKMTELFVDKLFYAQLKKNARNMIVNRYEQDVVWQALLEEYKNLEDNV